MTRFRGEIGLDFLGIRTLDATDTMHTLPSIHKHFPNFKSMYVIFHEKLQPMVLPHRIGLSRVSETTLPPDHLYLAFI